MRLRTKLGLLVLAVVGLAGLFGPYAEAQEPESEPSVPNQINFQGLLTNAEGQAVSPNGVYGVDFRLWSDRVSEASDQRLWGQYYEVTVIDGRFNVVLGAAGGQAIADSPNKNIGLVVSNALKPLHLELSVVKRPGDAAPTRPGARILPRQALLSAPYALQSGDGTPVGTIVAWYSRSGKVPHRWLPCNGQTVTDSDSPLIGMVLPNLNGNNNQPKRFIRGTSSAAPAPGTAPPTGGSENSGPVLGVDLNKHQHLQTIVDANGRSAGPAVDALFGANSTYGAAGLEFKPWTALNTIAPTTDATLAGTGLLRTSQAIGVDMNAHYHSVVPPHVEVRYIIRVK